MSARRPPSDSLPAPRPALEPEWLDIWTAGEPLHSRLEHLAAGAAEAAAGRPEALAPWARAFADGDETALLRRLSWDGIAPGAAAAALAAPREATARPGDEEVLMIARFEAAAGAASAIPDADTTLPFVALWRPWLEAARDGELLAALGAAGIADPARTALERALLARLAQAGELAAYEMFDRVRAAARAASGIHDAFRAQLLAGALRDLYAAYPLLLRQSVRLALDWRDATLELARRLTADRAALAAAFGGGAALGEVREIAALDSDPHHGGRRVLRLDFASGVRAVYKPRDVAMEAALAAFADWLAAAGFAEPPRAARTLARAGYGWQEWIAAEALESEAEAHTWYRRAGAWLAVAHLLRGRDLHAENLVATRRGPVIVDAEMFLQPEELRLGAAAGAPRSCLATGLLGDPLRRGAAWRPGMGGLEAPAEHRLGGGARRWENLGGDAISLSVAEVWSRPQANAVALHGAWLRPGDHAGDLAAGFAAACRFLLGRRAELMAEDGPLAAFGRASVRVLFRASQQDADVLALLVQPRHQRDGRQAGLLLERLLQPFAGAGTRPLLWPLAADERRALERLDLPRFTMGAASRTLQAESGERIDGVAARSGLESTREGISRLDEAEIERQLELLSRALERSAAATAPLPVEAGFAAEALRIGELLLRELDAEGTSPAPSTPARTGDAGEPARSAASLSRRSLLLRSVASATSGEDERDGSVSTVAGRDLSASLAVGEGGVALFLAGLFAHTGDERWRVAAGRILKAAVAAKPSGNAASPASPDSGASSPPGARGSLPSHPEGAGGRRPAESGRLSVSLGGFTGVGGRIWALVWCARLLGDPRRLDEAEEAARRLSKQDIGDDLALDVHDGVAGAALGLLALWEERRAPWMLGQAVACGERLLETRDEGGGWRDESGLPRLGFAHGACGAARALAALGRASGDGRFAEAARRAFESERGEFDARRGDWPVLWREPASGAVRRSWLTAWCRGAPGAALGRALAAPEGAAPASLGELMAALETTRRAAPAAVDFLCCGSLGRAAVLADLGARFERPALADAARELALAAWARAVERGGWQLGPPGEAPLGEWALLKGLAGIGWQMLALEPGSGLPSLLALELPAEHESRLTRRKSMLASTSPPPPAAPAADSDAFRIARLDPAAAAGFGDMTFPVYRHLLTLRPGSRHPEQGDTRPIQPLAFAALAGGERAGLLLLEMPLGDSRPPEVLSLFVAPPFRRRGVGSALVAAAEREIRERGFSELDAVYTTGRPGSAIAEHLLERRGWEAPETRTVLVQIVPRDFLASSLLAPARVAALDPGFEYFSWADLDPAERQELIDSDARQPWVTKGLWAWKYDTEGFDRATSLGVRWGGQIVGWVLSQRIDATSVRYLASFLRKDLSRRSRILPLYRESLERGRRDGVELATWVTPMLYPSMIRFIQKWMAPHARLVAETRGRKLRFPPSAV
jgi:lantibiotic modifying enzyme/GNAT superfamily N-acetyltransferase